MRPAGPQQAPVGTASRFLLFKYSQDKGGLEDAEGSMVEDGGSQTHICTASPGTLVKTQVLGPPPELLLR